MQTINRDLSPTKWRPAWRLAADVHALQTVPGQRSNYLAHIGEVVLELIAAHFVAPLDDLDLAVQCAILHDTIEDQGVTPEEIERQFGSAVARGVLALSKSRQLPKADALRDSLDRIRQQPRVIWCVKLADRVSNLQSAPATWSAERRSAYKDGATAILTALGDANEALASRLKDAIAAYPIDAT